MTSYSEHLAEDRRLALLRLLREAPEFSANDSVLHSGLSSLGHRVARDTVKDDIRWLRDRGLLRVDWVMEVVMVAELTQRGQDCARGLITVEGVKKPGPRG